MRDAVVKGCNNGSTSCTNYRLILLNPDILESNRWWQWILGHEIGHLLHLDTMHLHIEKQFDRRLKHLYEIRADIMASLVSLQQAQLGCESFADCLNGCNHDTSEHPSCIERYQTLFNLYAHMKSTVTIPAKVGSSKQLVRKQQPTESHPDFGSKRQRTQS